MNTDPHNHNCTHHRTTVYTSTTHSDTHIYHPSQKWMHIPGSAPPIRDSTPFGQSGNHPNHQGTTHTIPIMVTQSQTWTHVPEETRTSTCHGQMHQDQAKPQIGLNHFSFIQEGASLSNIEPFSYFTTSTTYFTYIRTKLCPHSHITYCPQLLPTDVPHALVSTQTTVGQTSSTVE